MIGRGVRGIGKVRRSGIESVSVSERLRRSVIGSGGRKMKMRVGKGK